MNYAKEREIANKKKWKAKIIVFIIVAVILFALTVFSWFVPMGEWKYHFQLPKVSARAENALRIHFLDVGQGDATLIEFPDDKVALIDGGNDRNENTATILRYMNALKINTIDYLVATHADGDHVGGLDTVLAYKSVRKAFIPKQVIAGEQYLQFYEALQKENCEIVYSERMQIAWTDTYQFSFLYPYEYAEEIQENNDNSAVLWLSYQDVSTLFMGDASAKLEKRLVDEAKNGLLNGFASHLFETDVLKVSHHGSKYSTCEVFLQYVQAKTAVISCGEENVYGHPHEETLQRLEDREIQTYRTDIDGNCMVTIADNTYRVEKIKK